MCTKLKSCCICFESSLDIITASETDDNNVKWSCKLRFCVPEVEWDEDCPVCQTCSTQIDTFSSFRSRCLQSNGFYSRLLNWGTDETDTFQASYRKCSCLLCSRSQITTDERVARKKVNYTCYMCNKTYSTKVTLTKHIASHSVVNLCSFCNQRFTTKTQLQLHVAQMHKNLKEDYVCRFCDAAFESVVSLNEHLGKNHQTFDCFKIECVAQSPSDDKMKQNPNDFKHEDNSSMKYSKASNDDFEIKYEDDELNNDECQPVDQYKDEPNDLESDNMKLELDIKNSASRSQRKTSRKTSFVCEECQNVFISSKKLINHAIKAHGFDPAAIKPFKCDKCDSKFSTSSNLLQHKKYHTGKRTHICTFCGKGYITKSDLNTHEKQHLNRREYQCSGCPKTFNTTKDLRSHRLVVHTDPSLWNYVCSFCQKRFPIKSNLDQHMRRHTGEKRFGCHICEKRFVDKIVLQKHIKSHSNFRAFKCNHCAKEYKDNRVLEVHLTKVHGIGNAKIPVRVKKYFCHVCPKSYFAKNKLTRHMFSHTGEKPFVCHICGRKFTDKSYVKQHLKTTHNVFEIDENK